MKTVVLYAVIKISNPEGIAVFTYRAVGSEPPTFVQV